MLKSITLYCRFSLVHGKQNEKCIYLWDETLKWHYFRRWLQKHDLTMDMTNRCALYVLCT
jgi:hypothetical protein